MSGPYDGYSHVPPYYQSQQLPPASQAEGFVPTYPHFHGIPAEYYQPTYPQVDDYGGPMGAAQGASRVRRRIGTAGEQVKHRRTRSGCYTCRNRRVKCDEARPTCERCRKGNRDCVYPEPNSTLKAKRRDSKSSKASHGESPSSPSGDEQGHDHKDDEAEGLSTIPDNEESEENAPEGSDSKIETSARHDSSPPSLVYGKSETPSTEDSTPAVKSARGSLSPASVDPGRLDPSLPLQPGQGQTQPKKVTQLPREMLFYLNYHRTHLTNYHYAFKYDMDDFFKTTYLEIALQNEPLLYAVVGFAAYHYTVWKGEGKVQAFLTYYNKSVTLLRLQLTKNPKPHIATLITILQLATIEEYLGDWVSLLSHQRAAHQLFISLYTPDTIMRDELSRKVTTWYYRYDLMAAVMSGSGIFLPREWWQARYDYYVQELQMRPDDLSLLYKERFGRNSIICHDVTSLWSRKVKGQVSEEDFNAEASSLEEQLTGWDKSINPLLTDPSRLVADFSEAPILDENDIVNPYEPNFMYGGPLWPTNLMLLDWWAFELMYKHQLAAMRRQPPPENSKELALKMLQMFEAIQLYPSKPAGIIVAAQATIGVAGLFMPKDDRHSLWVRKKLASVETFGYCYPKSFREKMTSHWGVDLTHWWLPNEEGLPPILRSIRNLIHDRSEGPQRDQISEDIRDMRGIFTSLSLDNDNGAVGESPISLVVSDDGRNKDKDTPPVDQATSSLNDKLASFGWQDGTEFMELDEAFGFEDPTEFIWSAGAGSQGG